MSRTRWLIVYLLLSFCSFASAQLMESSRITAADSMPDEKFGWGLASNGDLVIVGAELDDDGGGMYSGSAYVFRRSGAAWTEEAKLVPSDNSSNDRFGTSAAISGQFAFGGAPLHTHAGIIGAGAVYVFRFDGTNWNEVQKLTASDAATATLFGDSMALSGDVLVVGGKGNEAAYVFHYDGFSWIEEAKLVASDGVAGQGFGVNVAIEGDTVVVGAASDAGAGMPGGAYVFRSDGQGGWTEEAKLVGSDTITNDRFGQFVDISADTIAVASWNDQYSCGGCTGAVYLYRWNGSAWPEIAKLEPGDGVEGDDFARCVRIDGSAVFVGAPTRSEGASETGAVYVYREDGGQWSQTAKLVQSDAASQDQFGWRISGTQASLFVSAPAAKNGRPGGVYEFVEPLPCLDGVVDGELPVDVLFVNGSAGDSTRSVVVQEGAFLWAALLAPPAGGNGKFLVHANDGEPSVATQTVLPASIGTWCFPALLAEGATPIAIWNNIGKEAAVGASEYFDGMPIPDPPRAPTVFLLLHDGDSVELPLGSVVTFQGIVVDPASASPKGVSATNPVVLRVW